MFLILHEGAVFPFVNCRTKSIGRESDGALASSLISDVLLSKSEPFCVSVSSFVKKKRERDNYQIMNA